MGVLTDAALKGDLDRVRELLAQGHNINERDEWGETPLCTGQLNIIRLMYFATWSSKGQILKRKAIRRGYSTFPIHFRRVAPNLQHLTILRGRYQC